MTSRNIDGSRPRVCADEWLQSLLTKPKHPAWAVFPYGWWIVLPDVYVVFDRKYCPIFMKWKDIVAITRSDQYVSVTDTGAYYYMDANGPRVLATKRQQLISEVKRLGIQDEIITRSELDIKGALPRWNWGDK